MSFSNMPLCIFFWLKINFQLNLLHVNCNYWHTFNLQESQILAKRKTCWRVPLQYKIMQTCKWDCNKSQKAWHEKRTCCVYIKKLQRPKYKSSIRIQALIIILIRGEQCPRIINILRYLVRWGIFSRVTDSLHYNTRRSITLFYVCADINLWV